MRTFGEFCKDYGIEPDDTAIQLYMKEESESTSRNTAVGLYLKSIAPCGCDGTRPCGQSGADCCIAYKNGGRYIPFEKVSYQYSSEYPRYVYNSDDRVVCPYCGYTVNDAHELFGNYSDDMCDYTCENCSEQFEIYRDITIDYVTYRLNDRIPLYPAVYVSPGKNACDICGIELNEKNHTHEYNKQLLYCNECYIKSIREIREGNSKNCRIHESRIDMAKYYKEHGIRIDD